MSKPGSIIKNTGAMLLGTIIRMFASFVLFVYLARKLGPAAAGEFSLILTLFWVFLTMAGLGIQPLLIREVAKDREKTGLILTNTSFLALIASFVMSGVMIGFSYVMGYSNTVNQATLWMSLALILTTVSLVFQAIFIAWEKAELVLIGMTWENIVRLIVGIPVLKYGGGIIEIAAVFALASLVNLTINMWMAHRQNIRFQFKIDFSICLWLIRLVPAFAGISISNTLFWHMDMLLLSRMVSKEELGYYSVALRIVNVIKLVLQSYKVAIQPVAARLFMESEAKFKSFCEKSLLYIFIFTIPVCVGGMILSDKILLLIFGEAFKKSNMIFSIAVWMLIPYGIVLVFATFLIASHRQNVDLVINLISTRFAYVTGILMIICLRIEGAAIAVLCAVSFFMALQLVYIYHHLFKLDFWRLTWKILLSAAVMGAIAFLLREFHVLFVTLLVIGLYFGMLAILKVFSFKDIKYLLSLRK